MKAILSPRSFSPLVTLVALAALGTAPVAARQATTFDQLESEIRADESIVVQDSSGRQFEGRVVFVTASTLEIASDGQGRTFAANEVHEVRRPRDSYVNGAIIGAATLGAALAISMAQCGGWCGGSGDKAAAVGGGLLVGAAIGVGIDALIGRGGTVYRAPESSISAIHPAPFVHPGARSVRLAIAF